ncbi:DegV family protein [Chloroflexota bacterium]
MSVKIITDSTSDILPDLAVSLGIEVVPGYVRFGNDTYRDGVDINKSGFYQKLMDYPVHPQTSEASPNDFAEIYSRYEHEAEGIVSIHISSKISRMYDSARKGKKKAKTQYAIEIIDSNFASIGLGLIVIAAARLANAGGSIKDIVNETKRAIGQTSMFGLFDTMKYVAKGGRVTKHVMELSSIFRIKPLLTFRDGEIVAEGIARTHSHGMERLFEYTRSAPY